jgi:hypothetical protein
MARLRFVQNASLPLALAFALMVLAAIPAAAGDSPPATALPCENATVASPALALPAAPPPATLVSKLPAVRPSFLVTCSDICSCTLYCAYRCRLDETTWSTCEEAGEACVGAYGC